MVPKYSRGIKEPNNEWNFCPDLAYSGSIKHPCGPMGLCGGHFPSPKCIIETDILDR